MNDKEWLKGEIKRLKYEQGKLKDLMNAERMGTNPSEEQLKRWTNEYANLEAEIADDESKLK